MYRQLTLALVALTSLLLVVNCSSSPPGPGDRCPQASPSQCEGDTPAFDWDECECVECVDHDDCESSDQMCNDEANECVAHGCTDIEPADCSGETPEFDPSSCSCLECLDDTDCHNGECMAGGCVEVDECNTDGDCPDGECIDDVCVDDSNDGTVNAGECTTDADCSHEDASCEDGQCTVSMNQPENQDTNNGDQCNLTSGDCSEPTPMLDAGECECVECLSEFDCDDGDCVDGICETTTGGECSDNYDCPDAHICIIEEEECESFEEGQCGMCNDDCTCPGSLECDGAFCRGCEIGEGDCPDDQDCYPGDSLGVANDDNVCI